MDQLPPSSPRVVRPRIMRFTTINSAWWLQAAN